MSSKIQDTQCGFKLFSKDASDAIFGTLHLRRWAFDTEVVLLCDHMGIPVMEVGVPWHEVDGSKTKHHHIGFSNSIHHYATGYDLCPNLLCPGNLESEDLMKSSSSTQLQKKTGRRHLHSSTFPLLLAVLSFLSLLPRSALFPTVTTHRPALVVYDTYER
jgi:hypothetical protein